MLSDKQKEEEIRRKRRLAAKGLKERKDGRPIDPMEDTGKLALDTDPDEPETAEETEAKVARNAAALGFALRRP
jgi:hypothetical protein